MTTITEIKNKVDRLRCLPDIPKEVEAVLSKASSELDDLWREKIEAFPKAEKKNLKTMGSVIDNADD